MLFRCALESPAPPCSLFTSFSICGTATRPKGRNSCTVLTQADTPLPECQQKGISLLEKPLVAQEAINQGSNHLHLAHCDMVAHYQSTCDSSCPNEWRQGLHPPSFCSSWERPSLPACWANTLARVTSQVAIPSIITPSLLLLANSSDGLAPWEYLQDAIGISFNWLSAKNVNPVCYPLSIVTSACNWKNRVFRSARRKGTSISCASMGTGFSMYLSPVSEWRSEQLFRIL